MPKSEALSWQPKIELKALAIKSDTAGVTDDPIVLE